MREEKSGLEGRDLFIRRQLLVEKLAVANLAACAPLGARGSSVVCAQGSALVIAATELLDEGVGRMRRWARSSVAGEVFGRYMYVCVLR